MPKVIDKVAAIVHYVDGRTEEGYFNHPCQPGGQYQSQFTTLWKDEGLETFINLAHVINIEQSIIYREADSNNGLKVKDFATRRCFLKG
ncbi:MULTISPECIES: hypothetical protein [Citrobacter]|uniref:Uncharacterized protein n=1 Tax=Citrobacter braakii TaxID=57706 RepID=A0ABR6U2V9_CITBR|nr:MULTISPECIES: hypothetical protein [Citrobacter]MBC2610793.1 hypothetical protein [Citrobacter braakii]MBC2637136.1 hypothetical protein [Citrobacter braakii]MBC2649855.1 hypothetical protein [Citrobacter braakii]MBW7622101.1 hypothetical protein [Citrobacter portucalensis]MBW7639762.1 hypothetical protein [Citrobacter portucalensis]